MVNIEPQPSTGETLEEKDDFLCKVCTEPTPQSKKFKNKSLCTHLICQDCIAKYVEIKIEDYETGRIRCPYFDCEKLLDPVSCMEIMKPSVFSKWCDILFEDSLLGLEKSFCPNKNCMALVVNECHRNNNKANCPKCKQLFCFRCKLAWNSWHHVCQESKNLRDPDDALHWKLAEKMRWARSNVKHQNRSHDHSHTNCRCKTHYSSGEEDVCVGNRDCVFNFMIVFFLLVCYMGVMYTFA